MQSEIVMIGTELLLGQIIDTNAAHIGKVLAENGIDLYQKTTVGDNRGRIMQSLDAALDRADVVLTSGGLGPTEDDITRDCIAELTGRPLEFRQDLYDQLAARFARMRRSMSGNNKKQAYAPRGAHAIENTNGTAPGLRVETERGVIIAMPGVPRELYAMLERDVLPYLRERFGLTGLLRYRVLKVCGMGESSVDASIGDIIQELANPKVGLLASPDAVRIRVSAKADTVERAEALISDAESRIRERLPGLIMGIDDDTLETVVDGLLRERGWTLALGETHTGGLMAQRLTAAGAVSFAGGVVAPAGRFAGQDLHAAASDWCREVRTALGTDAALVLAADPDKEDSVAAFVSPEQGETAVTWDVGFGFVRETSQVRAAVICLEQLRRRLLGVEVT